MATKKVHIDILAKDKTRAALRGAQKGINNLKSSVLNLKVALAGIGGAVVARSFLNTARDIERLQNFYLVAQKKEQKHLIKWQNLLQEYHSV